ncbi:hypothetical protein [Endozoicomonas elysicola]|uniref:hypothetical protein n=1 Tax=Endozoicomonas elysicola TaxID=305900 RepID=UPI000369B5C5|nr:hypothetical protein [Endozoicomonas elysicola]
MSYITNSIRAVSHNDITTTSDNLEVLILTVVDITDSEAQDASVSLLVLSAG